MVRTKPSPCCMAVISFLFCAVVQAPYRRGDVMLGGLFSIHQSQGTSEGKCGKITKEVTNAQAMIFAIDKINNDSNILPNISLGYDIRDYCGSNENATRITYELLRDKCSVNTTLGQLGEGSIVAFIGPSFSSTATFIAGILQMLNVSGISGSTTSSELTSHTYKHLYRTVPADIYSAKAVADTIDHFNWTYVAAIGVDDSFGRNAVWSLINEAKRRNGSFCVALTDFIPHNTKITKAKEIVTKLKRQENIRVIIVWLYATNQWNFFKEITVQNLSERVWIFTGNGPDNLYERGFLSADFSPLHGSIGIEPHNFQEAGFKEYLKTILLPYEANKKNIPEWWNDTTTLMKNCSPGKDSLTQHGEDHQNDFCVQNIVNEVYNSYVPYVIDAVYSVAHALDMSTRDTSKMDNDGQRKRPYLKLNDMQSLLSRVNFTGLTGNIFFDEFGDRHSASYDIVNYQQETENGATSLKRVIVGKWHDREGLQLSGTIRWNSQTGRFPKSECLEQCSAGTRKSTTSPCCWQCIPCPRGTINSVPGAQTCIECPRGKRSNEARTACKDLPLANFHYSSPGGIAVLSFGALGMITTLAAFAVVCRFWNTPIVKACNRGPSLALLPIIILMLSIAFINLFRPTDTICKIIYPWRYITYSLCLSLLLVKVLRISSAFEIPFLCGYKITSLTNRMQAVIVVTLQVFLLIVLLIWLHIDPPFTMEQIYPEQYTFIHCKAYSTAAGKILFSLTCSYILMKMLLCAFCSFKVRNVPENFSEAKRIAFSMYMFLISLLAYYPVKFSMEGWYVTVADCVTTLLSAYGFLVCIFLPKIYIILYKPELNTSVNVRQEVIHFSFGPRFVRESPAFKSSTQQNQT